MISAIGTLAAINPIHVPSAVPSGDASANQSSTVGITSPIGADVLSLSQPDSLATNDGFYQKTSLMIRSHSRVSVSDDGQVRASSHTKLRFSYIFEADDGTKIRIRAKVNLHYSQITDGDEGSQSTRLRAKARVSVLQENVSSGIAALLESPDVSADAKSGISQAIDQFAQFANEAASLFLDGDPLDGDGLIAGLVDAFNGLSESLNSIFLSPPADPQSVPSGDVVGLLEQVASEASGAVASAPDQTEAVPPIVVASEPLAEAPPQEIAQSDVVENGLVANADQGEASALENTEIPLAIEQEGPGEGQNVQASTSEQSQPSVASVMFRLRLQVIQSLTNLVGAFDSDSTSLTASQSIFRASLQFAARYNFSVPGLNDAASNDGLIDTHV